MTAANIDKPFDPHGEWQAMPEYESKNLQPAYRVVVSFTSEAHAEEFLKLIGARPLARRGGRRRPPKRRSIWWPESDGHRGEDRRDAYVAAEPAQAA
jgi:hypothetical protein